MRRPSASFRASVQDLRSCISEQQRANLLDREIEIAATPNEGEPVDVFIIVGSLAASSGGRAQQSNLPIKANGRSRRSGPFGQYSNPHCRTCFLRLNLKWLEGVPDQQIGPQPWETHISVIGPSCIPPSENSPGCGCAAAGKVDGRLAGRAVGAAAATALVAAACTACCILPFTLPASLLTGGSIAVLDHAHGWATRLAIAVVGCAWLWIGWRVRKTKRRISAPTLLVMAVATLLTASAASWPLIEPAAFGTMGIVKKKAVAHGG
jgi:hypothetical protein